MKREHEKGIQPRPCRRRVHKSNNPINNRKHKQLLASLSRTAAYLKRVTLKLKREQEKAVQPMPCKRFAHKVTKRKETVQPNQYYLTTLNERLNLISTMGSLAGCKGGGIGYIDAMRSFCSIIGGSSRAKRRKYQYEAADVSSQVAN